MGRRDDDDREDGEAEDAPETAFPDGIDAKTTEAGGEVSMSLEETNRVREKLGLKPLRTGESDRAKRQREAEERAHAARRDAEKSKETAEIAVRIAAAKEKRQMEARNRATAQLGEADDADDDLSAWVNKSRDIELKKKLEEKRKAEELARKLAEQDDDFEDSESDDDAERREKKRLGDVYASDALAGLRVRHGADEVAEGETVILTLKDSSILDETRTGVNDEGDELENVLLTEEKRRKRARAEASKRPAAGSPFGEEDETATDGPTVLGKYDEKKDDDALTLNDAGAVSAAEERRKAEIRRRLAASLGGVSETAREQSAATEKKTLAEFFTPAEVAAREAAEAAAKFNKPKKKRRKKLREKKLDVDELEGDALVPATSELGSRRRREEEGSAADAAAATDRWRRDAQFAAALTKAKRRTDERILAEMAGDGPEAEEDDDELERALERSRRAAAEGKRGGVDFVVAAVAERRAKDEAEEGADRAGGTGGVVFSDTQEFVQGIAGGAPEEGAAGDETGAAEDEEMPPAPPPPPPGADADADSDGAMPPPPPPPPGTSPPPASADRVNLGGISESSTASKGLAATLELLKDTGKLRETEMWDGRTNDKKPLALQRAREAAALPSGEHEGKKFDFNLDKYDEFGRKMTPKEAFRDLCHKFHGIEPSKNKKEKRLKQYQEEMKQKKLAEKLAEEGAVGSMESMKRVQQVSHSPFLMLDGKLRAGQSSNAEGAFAPRDEETLNAKSADAAGNDEPKKVVSRLGAVGGKAKVAFQMSRPKR